MTKIRRTQSVVPGRENAIPPGVVRFGIIGSGHVGQATARALLSSRSQENSSVPPTEVLLTYRSSGPPWSRPGVLWRPLDLTTDVRVPRSSAGFADVARIFAGCRAVLVPFPVVGEEQPSEAFFESLRAGLGALAAAGTAVCVLSSTSAYRQASGVVSEESPWDTSQARFAAEEELRLSIGATVIPLSGLFGPGRDPLVWLAEGRIRDLSGSVNLIHHDDAGVCVAEILKRPRRGERINVASGELHWWAALAHEHRIVPPGLTRAQVADALARCGHSQVGGLVSGRLISNAKLLASYEDLRSLIFRRVGDAP